MLNNVALTGRLTKDVELKYLGTGTAVGTFTLAVNRTFKNKQGENEADFINIVVWRNQAENCANYIRKGSLVAVEGRIQSRTYDNQEGKKIYVTEVVANMVHFLDTRKKNDDGYNAKPKNQIDKPLPRGLNEISDADESELPF